MVDGRVLKIHCGTLINAQIIEAEQSTSKMNNLNAFNPLNIVSGGGNKIQHPASGYSSTISHNVEGMHKEFIAFHKNLKNMVMLYKTRHQLMESLNENGLYVST